MRGYTDDHQPCHECQVEQENHDQALLSRHWTILWVGSAEYASDRRFYSFCGEVNTYTYVLQRGREVRSRAYTGPRNAHSYDTPWHAEAFARYSFVTIICQHLSGK